jgi:hypothetical protein
MSRPWSVCFVVGLALLPGCGPRALPKTPDPVPVTGKIVLANGEPLRGGRLHFEPHDSANQHEPFADIQKDGTFAPTTKSQKKGDGLPVGKYTVSIEMISYISPPDFQPVAVPNDQNIPERYFKAETSDKTIEITNGPNDITITLGP